MATNLDTHEHYHQPGLQHQFEDMGQQQESDSIGMWMFLVQEIMFFGGMFTVYLVFRSKYPMAFAAGSNHLNEWLGMANTLVLIVSSLTMALAVHYAQLGKRNLQVILLFVTMIFGMVFLGIKAYEYAEKYNDGIVPVTGLNRKTYRELTENQPFGLQNPETQRKNSLSFPGAVENNVERFNKNDTSETGGHEEYVNPRGDFIWKETALADKAFAENTLTNSEKIGYMENGEISQSKFQDKVRIFFWIYFAMTALHALHMIIGLGIMSWLLWKAWRYTFTPEYYAPVEMVGLYWHFVDIVWIFLFPLLYLLGRHFGE
ncbi:MAG: cytochrome c oxidase subunit 3 family protein [Acidobacteriota bacterium]|nr:cytochrome c oxidase subunit 3 family protein [Acidobacteriota bacterium]